jgi:myo-inositol 2-dehydrogenase/D-chiro-inositol 1-dehydrogenase/scyllo-inositol 2-dehydrogenase (NAD+)
VHTLNIHRHLPDAHVAAVVDDDEVRAGELAARVGSAPVNRTLTVALAEQPIDAVVIATPTDTHCRLALEAFAAGAHVFCEKPLALTAQDCDAMIGAAENAGRRLQVGFVRRFQPEFVEAQRRIVEGDIGAPMLIKSLTRGPGLPPAWAQDLASSNGMLAEVNSHDFDCVRWLIGSELVRVYAEVANHKGARLGVADDHFYDNAVVTLRFANDAIGTIDGTCPAEYGYDARVEVIGTEGMLQIGETLGRPLVTFVDRSRGGYRPVHQTWPDRFDWGYLNEIRSFVDSIEHGSAPLATGLDGKRAVEAVVAANTSWQSGLPVELPTAVAPAAS